MERHNSQNQQRNELLTDIFLKYKRLMFSIVRNYTEDMYEQEDIIQETLIRLCRKTDILENLSEPVLICYIKKSIQNTALNHQKKRSKERLLEQPLDSLENNNYIPQLSLEEILIDKDKRSYFYKLFEQLSASDRDLLSDKYWLGLSDSEIAEKLHCKKSSIRMKLTRARRNFLHLYQLGSSENEE